MRKLAFILLIALFCLPQATRAHGGAFIINEQRGQKTTLASIAPAPLVVGTGDMSVSIFYAETATMLQVDEVRIEAIAPNGTSRWYETTFDPQAVSYDQHAVEVTESGVWTLAVEITEDGETERYEGTVNVGGTGTQMLTLLAYILPLVLLIGLVGIAALRNRMLGADADSVEENLHDSKI